MNYFEIIAIFFAPIIGATIYLKKENLNLKELILIYPRYLFTVNFITALVVFILKDYNAFVYTISFFIKYGIMNFVFSIFIALLEISLKKNIKVEVYEKNKD